MPTTPTIVPWRKAEALTRCHLYWFGAKAFPLGQGELEWTTKIVLALDKILSEQFNLTAFFVVAYSYVNEDNADRFVELTTRALPQVGLRRNPGESVPRMTRAQVQEIADGKKTFDPREFMEIYLMRLVNPNLELYLRNLWGKGESLVVFVPRQPGAKLPPMPKVKLFEDDPFMKDFDPAKMFEAAAAYRHPSLKASKELLAGDLAEDPTVSKLEFVLPRLNTQFYFAQPENIVKTFMELFPVQILESPGDKGIVLAAKHNLDATLKDLTERFPWPGAGGEHQ